ncbi:hypothetical protein [Mesorhizobium sp. L103C131B0]|nr:hypothetical protein [Mesorhizobium sp. L103C131B0]
MRLFSPQRRHMAFDQAHVLGLDSHQWPEADGHLVAADARDRAD